MHEENPQQKLLEYAITREEKAHEFYQNLARQADHPLKRRLFERFAREELSHKEKLEKQVSIEQEQMVSVSQIDSKYLPDDRELDVNQETKVQLLGILSAAMQREKNAYRLYMYMALKTSDEQTRETLIDLARDEAHHRALLEMELDQLADSGQAAN